MAQYYRLATRIEEKISPEPNSGCWLWTGSVDRRNGYAKINMQGKKTSVVHKLLYENKFGPVPKGLELDHKCRVKCCVNPDHLEPVTHAENLQRWSRALTHCRRGHPFDEANTIIKQNGGKLCRACVKASRDRSAAKLNRSIPK